MGYAVTSVIDWLTEYLTPMRSCPCGSTLAYCKGSRPCPGKEKAPVAQGPACDDVLIHDHVVAGLFS